MTDLYAILTAAGLDVAPVAGWEDRIRAGEWAPCGVMVHHTAGTKSLATIVAGRPGLAGPLANLHIPKSGAVNLVSAGRCNHAGRGAWEVLARVRDDQPPLGDAAAMRYTDGPVGNGLFYGIEAENLGDGRDPWPPEQVGAVVTACAALCRHHGWTANRVIAHREWTRRKVDPRGLSMDALRAAVARLLHTQEDGMTEDEHETLMAIAAKVDGIYGHALNAEVDGVPLVVSMAATLETIRAQVQALDAGNVTPQEFVVALRDALS